MTHDARPSTPATARGGRVASCVVFAVFGLGMVVAWFGSAWLVFKLAGWV